MRLAVPCPEPCNDSLPRGLRAWVLSDRDAFCLDLFLFLLRACLRALKWQGGAFSCYHGIMKAERLMGILNLLLNKRKLSASSLARHFEVSVRTIYRDVDALAQAGVPVFATNGRDGGFELMEGFTVDRQVLETADIRGVLTALESLKSILPGAVVSNTLEKYRLLLKQTRDMGIGSVGNRIFIELSPSTREKKLIEALDRAIVAERPLVIGYSDTDARLTERVVEPQALVFIWQAWYVFAWCRLRADYRLFRVSRIQRLETLAEARLGPPADLESRPWNALWDMEQTVPATLLFPAPAKTRIRELFNEEDIEEGGDGCLTVRTFLPINGWSVSFLAGIPGGVTVLEPAELREMIKKYVFDIFSKNTDTGCHD